MIDEIPIEDSPVEVNVQDPVEIVEPPKKSRGRPKGVVNKPKAKPKVEPEVEKPKPRVKKPKPVYEESEDEYETPQQPTYNTRDIASEVISMLSNRHLDRSAQKREKYRSWFQNPQY